MKRWIIILSILLLVGVAGYLSYHFMKDTGDEVHNEAASPAKEAMHEHENEHGHNHIKEEDDGGLVQTEVDVNDDYLDISIKDDQGRYVNDLQVTHEKLLHLIVISSDMKAYRHLHPEQVGDGQFRIKHQLPDGHFKAFIDIDPKGKAYHVEPVPFVIGEGARETATLHESKNLTLEQNGHKVTLSPGPWMANEETTLLFDLHEQEPEPYLGSNGHVVIINERADEYLHVHPAKNLSFHTEFSDPGLYKVWAEFKFDGRVHTFPFVIKVTE